MTFVAQRPRFQPSNSPLHPADLRLREQESKSARFKIFRFSQTLQTLLILILRGGPSTRDELLRFEALPSCTQDQSLQMWQ